MWSAKYRAYGNLATLDISEIDNPLRFVSAPQTPPSKK
ncbi:Rhs family protein [Pseudomonas syringae pv. actinidiae ICMP 18883]|nr:Rhs family protein [Pseudomonas syringae pv. actinidiae ICMP 18883]